MKAGHLGLFTVLKQLKIDRIISIATLIASLTAIFLVLHKPSPQPQVTSATVEHTSEQKNAQVETPQAGSAQSAPQQTPYSGAQTAPRTTGQVTPSATPSSKDAVNSQAISAILAKTFGQAGASALSLDSEVGSSAPNIKDQQVTTDGDVVHGKFLTEIGGKDVWVTISGHMGDKDGYATFDPTEIKVGDMEVPVSLVNPMLQKKLAEERDRLKIPDSTSK